jgi:GTP cyclohydrolase I
MQTMYDEVRAKAAVREFLIALGEDPDREGLRGTPQRVARAWREMLVGMDGNARALLKTSEGKDGFDIAYDEIIVIGGIPFTSMCEHHMLPFSGTADVGYLPAAQNSVIVGASKIPRLVRHLSRQLQVQERLTNDIARTLAEATNAQGVGVRVVAEHSCMACRGVGVRAPMATEALLGRFREHEIRAEFWELSNRAREVLHGR